MTIDTNIIIAYLDGEHQVIKTLSEWRQQNRPLFLPTITESEVLSFSGWTEKERKITEKFLEENFTSISFDRNIARVAAEIRSNNKIKFPDAAIAATALFTHTPLATRNIKDFQRINDLYLIKI